MGVASQIGRIQGLRDRIRNKLVGLGLISQSAADLEDCTDAIEAVGGTLDITDTVTHDVAGKQYARVIDANLVPGNIVSGVSILGVAGTASVQPPQANLTQGTMEYGGTAAPSTLTPPTGYDGFSSVVPQLASRPVLVPANIKSGVTVMGVTGTMDGWNHYSGTVTASDSASLDIRLNFTPTSYTTTDNFIMHVRMRPGKGTSVDATERLVVVLWGCVNAFVADIVSAAPCAVYELGSSYITTQFTLVGISVTVNDNNTLFTGDYEVDIFWR